MVTIISLGQSKSDFDSLLINQFDNQSVPGYSILVGNFDSIIYEKQYGLANISLQREISDSTKFRIGSITKQFTAVAILKLVEEGKLDLTTPARTYVEFLPKKITIAHLLWHTSGLISYFNDLDIPASAYKSKYSSKELVNLLEGKKVLSKPDTEYHYSNSGYHILGFIIEQVSDLAYSEYLQQNIFTPYHMNNTECEFMTSSVENLAIGYEYYNSKISKSDYYTMDWPYAAGNIVSTPGDLLKWNNALFQGKIISDSLLKIAHTAHILKKGLSTHYGFGWEIREIQEETSIRHSGFLDGYLSTLIFFPKYNITIVVLNNCSDYATELVASKLGALAIGKPIKSPKRYPLSIAELKNFENNYDFDGGVISFAVMKGELSFYLDDNQNSYHPLYPISETVFYSSEYGCTVSFDTENKAMTLIIGGRETTGKQLNHLR